MPVKFKKQFFEEKRALITVLSSLGMIAGFMGGRAILSASMLLFCANALWCIPLKQHLQNKWWLLGLLWVGLYVISYFWCEDIPYWQERVQVKLPFVFLPLAFSSLPFIGQRYLKLFTFGIIIILFAGTLYSLSFLLTNPEQVFKGYFFSTLIPTPAYKDHIRFSIFAAWVVLWCFYILTKLNTKTEKYLVGAAAVYFILFLHLLAARSGLLVLYLFAFCYFIYIIIKGKLGKALLLSVISITCVCILYQKVPSFKYRMLYIKLTYEEYKRGNLTADFSDMGRLISYQLAAKVIREHPVAGVGVGDVREEMKHMYEKYSPDTLPEQRIVPHNQFMEVAMGLGLIGLLAFSAWYGYLLRGIRRYPGAFYLVACWLGFLASMMVEAMLEVQFGVFVFLFCFLWIQKAIVYNKETLPDATPAAV